MQDVLCSNYHIDEGHFASLNEVHTYAITLAIPALLAAEWVLSIVPEGRKVAAVHAALFDPLSPDLPATILRTSAHARPLLDQDSASACFR